MKKKKNKKYTFSWINSKQKVCGADYLLYYGENILNLNCYEKCVNEFITCSRKP